MLTVMKIYRRNIMTNTIDNFDALLYYVNFKKFLNNIEGKKEKEKNTLEYF